MPAVPSVLPEEQSSFLWRLDDCDAWVWPARPAVWRRRWKKGLKKLAAKKRRLNLHDLKEGESWVLSGTMSQEVQAGRMEEMKSTLSPWHAGQCELSRVSCTLAGHGVGRHRQYQSHWFTLGKGSIFYILSLSFFSNHPTSKTKKQLTNLPSSETLTLLPEIFILCWCRFIFPVEGYHFLPKPLILNEFWTCSPMDAQIPRFSLALKPGFEFKVLKQINVNHLNVVRIKGPQLAQFKRIKQLCLSKNSFKKKEYNFIRWEFKGPEPPQCHLKPQQRKWHPPVPEN